MSLHIGIVGLPNVGKSTLFNALTKKSVSAENFPFCTIDPSVGVVGVPDARLATLTKIADSAKTIPTAIEFVDIAGLVRGAAEGEGLGNQFLAHIREVDAIVHMVRIFDDPGIIHVHDNVDPMSDIGIINLELILADAQTTAKRLASIERDAKRGDKEAIAEQEILRRISIGLEAGKFAADVIHDSEEQKIIRGLHLLTMKPMLYVLNKKAGGHNLDGPARDGDTRWQELTDYLRLENKQWVIVDANIENELKDVADEDKAMFRQEFETHDDGVNDLIRASYDLLGLLTFFTTGPDETRAWTVVRGASAPEAGAAIHSDFRDKFIRAEIVHFDRLVEAGSLAAAREKGWVRTEGKQYIVQDGDVVEFKI